MSVLQLKAQAPFDELIHAIEQLNLPDLERLQSRLGALTAKRKTPALTSDETTLLLKINQGLPPATQKRFNMLIKKRRAETLTPAEHQELLDLTAQIESADVARLECLAQLARLRGVTLPEVMRQLDIKAPAYV